MAETLKQARTRQRRWSEESKRGSRCPMCGRPFADCSHGVADVDRWFETQVARAAARAAVRAELAKQGELPMSVVSAQYLRDTLRDLRAASDDAALTRLKILAEGVFDRTCDDLRDIVVGRLVNEGVEGEKAKTAGDAVDEYRHRNKKD